MTAPDARAWLDQVDARTNAATDGPWHALTTGRAGGDHWHVTDAGESLAYIHASDGEDEDRRQPDAEFIAAARTDLPAATAALRAVLDLHTPIGALLNPGRHERIVKVCTGCGTDDGNWQRHPCPTVTAITTALEDA